MSQIFRPSANQLARFSLVIGLIFVVGAALGILGLMRSDYVTGANTNIAQPIQFSHAHHVGGLADRLPVLPYVRGAVVLLVGMFMGVLYAAMGARSPQAFLVLGAPASPENFPLASAVYFSFVTLATLGYGDIVPTAEATRGLAVIEAVGGSSIWRSWWQASSGGATHRGGRNRQATAAEPTPGSPGDT